MFWTVRLNMVFSLLGKVPGLHKEIMQMRPEEGLGCYRGDLRLPSYQAHSIASEDRAVSQNCEDTRESIRNHS